METLESRAETYLARNAETVVDALLFGGKTCPKSEKVMFGCVNANGAVCTDAMGTKTSEVLAIGREMVNGIASVV